MKKHTSKRRRNNKTEIIVVAVCVIIVVGLIALVTVYNKGKDFIYNKHLDEKVITINNEDITLKEFSYYVYIVEAQVNDMALRYNPADANEFWNTYFKNSLDSVFTRDYAKQLAIDLCEYDYIMEKESTVYNIYVTDAEKESCRTDAKDKYDDMSQKAHENTKLNEDDIYNILCRKKLVEKYVTRAAKKIQEEGYQSDLLSYDGEFYKENIKTKYEVKENEKILDKITMGRITIN